MDTESRAAQIADDMRQVRHLLTVLGGCVGGKLPWQRQLKARLDELGDLLQIATMAVMMDRTESELRDAARTLAERARHASLAITGSRAELQIHVTLRLVVGLAQRIHKQLEVHATHEDVDAAD